MQLLRIYGALARRPRRLQGMDLALMTQRTAVSIDKARRLLGYAPRVDVAEGMLRCASWLRQEGHLPSGVRSRSAAMPAGHPHADAADGELAAAGG
jgi:hypothetical protein